MKIIAGMGVLPLLSAGSALAADFDDRIEYRMQRHGDHIDQRLERHGERLQASLDRRDDRAERHWDVAARASTGASINISSIKIRTSGFKPTAVCSTR